MHYKMSFRVGKGTGWKDAKLFCLLEESFVNHRNKDTTQKIWRIGGKNAKGQFQEVGKVAHQSSIIPRIGKSTSKKT